MNFSGVIRSILLWVFQKRWFLISLVIGCVALLFDSPESLSANGYRVLLIAFIVIVSIVTEAITLPALALFIIFSMVVLGIGSSEEIAHAYMNDAVFFIMGSLMIAVALTSQGFDSRLALAILWLTGGKTRTISLGFVTVSALLSAFLGEHTVAALMLPTCLILIRNLTDDPAENSKLTALLLFSIAYGSTIGSVGTPSGGARNPIMINYWVEFGLDRVGYLEWMKWAFPVVLIQIPLLAWILNRVFTPELKQLDSSIRKLKIQVRRRGDISGKETLTLLVLGIVFLGWILFSEEFGLGMIAIFGAFLYVIFGVVEWEEISRKLNWGVILMFGSAILLGIQMKEAGTGEWIANQILGVTGNFMEQFQLARYGMVIVMTTVFANMMSASATVAVVAPVTLNFGADQLVIGFLTAISSSFAFFTAVAAPACMIVYSSGYLRAKDFIKAGVFVGVMSFVVLLFVAMIYWPMIA
ncbi:DASS family sodium-coupled anion symporter [bacterium]|nr:DASS family sodium-coupled anion symporter [bacterium]